MLGCLSAVASAFQADHPSAIEVDMSRLEFFGRLQLHNCANVLEELRLADVLSQLRQHETSEQLAGYRRPPTLYNVISNPSYIQGETLKMSSNSPDFGLFAFTFGVYDTGP